MLSFQYRLLLLMAIGLAACTKESSPDPSKTPELLLSKKVTAFYYDFSQAQPVMSLAQPLTYQNTAFYPLTRRQDTYQYDSQNRLISFSARNPDRLDYTYEWSDVAYEYVGNKMIYTNLRIYPLLPVNYTLNEQGYITEYNMYDQEGYLVYRQNGPKATTTQTISEGNIVKEVYQDAILRQTRLYEYDLSKPGLPNPDQVMQGRSSRNLVIKTTQTDESFTGVAPIMPNHSITTYTYEFDSRGVVKQQAAYTERNLLPNPTIMSKELQISTFEFK